MNIVVLLAGGMGSRMGQDIPKQFIHVNNRPVIIYTLLALERHPEIDAVEVVCIEGWEQVLLGYAKQFNITKLRGVVPGGATRFLSTKAGMMALGDVKDDDVLIVHDAVRPLVAADSISDMIRVCREHENAMTVLDCVDTMYLRKSPDSTSQVVERAGLVRGQTPECVSGRRMREMYARAAEQGVEIDSISALQVALGWNIFFAKGSERNIKLTRTEDIDMFKAMLATERDDWLK